MSPDWWERAEEAARDRHDPDDYDGLEWDQLNDEQIEAAVYDVLADIAETIY